MSRKGAGLFAPLLIFILCCALLLAPAACDAAKKVPPPPDGALKPSEVVWSQQKDGLSVTVAATDDLNFAYGSPLGITICLYQLSDMSKFTALAATFDGVRKLLEGDIELLGGTALMSRVEYLQPGEKITRSFDRMEGAKYFAVAAGYAHRDPARCSAYAPFPVEETVIKVKRRTKVTYYTAGTLAAGVLLNSEAVTVTGGEGGYER